MDGLSMKKTWMVMATASAALTALCLVGCGNDTAKTETKTVTTITRTPTGISKLWGEERVTKEEKYEVRTLNAPK